MLMFKVVFSLFQFSYYSNTNQSVSSIVNWVLNSQSEFDWVLYKHRREFLIHGKIISMLTCPLLFNHAPDYSYLWLEDSTYTLFFRRVQTQSSGWGNDDTSLLSEEHLLPELLWSEAALTQLTDALCVISLCKYVTKEWEVATDHSFSKASIIITST